MILKKYNSIMQMGEDYRNKWAFGLTVTCSVLILTSFVFYKGFLTFGNEFESGQKSNTQVANIVSADLAPSPLQSSKKTFDGMFSQIIEQYDAFKESVGAVLVPFVTGIDVYERK